MKGFLNEKKDGAYKKKIPKLNSGDEFLSWNSSDVDLYAAGPSVLNLKGSISKKPVAKAEGSSSSEEEVSDSESDLEDLKSVVGDNLKKKTIQPKKNDYIQPKKSVPDFQGEFFILLEYTKFRHPFQATFSHFFL